ncbi:MAG TPA: hypothetical protein VKM55_24765 [Candidatus Lokiarchaeia archaeon]|nr:hypothetical protein [Candidatus Lokiarchaeia archaeon]
MVSGVTANASASTTILGTGYINFLITIATGVATQTLSITANVLGTEEISGRALSAGPSAALSVTIKAQASLQITGPLTQSGNGTYVAGMTFTVRVPLSNNPATNARAKFVNATLSGLVGGVTANSSAVKTILGTGYIDFLITIASATATQSISITATVRGTEEISGRGLNPAPSATLNVNITAQASLSITSITYLSGNSTYVGGTAFTVRVTLSNSATAARAKGVTVSLSYGGYSGLSSNGSISTSVLGTGKFDFLVTVAGSATSQNPVLISAATVTATEDISGRGLSAASASPLSVAIKAQATLVITAMTYSIPGNGNGTYVGGMTFVVRVTLQNPASAARALGVSISLSYGGYVGLSTNASAVKTVSGTVNFDLLVTIIAGATSQNPVSISTATVVGATEEISGRSLSAASASPLNVRIKAQASPSISSITYTTGIGTYIGGMTLVVRVTVQNPAASAKAQGVSVTLSYGGYSGMIANASAVKNVSGTVNFDFLVTVAAGATSQNPVFISASFTATEEISHRILSGVSGSSLSIAIQGQAIIELTSINYRNGTGTYVGNMKLVVRVSFQNIGATTSNGIKANLTYGGYVGLSSNGSGLGIVLNPGASGYSDFLVSVSKTATTAIVTINATWSGTEAISSRSLSGNAGTNVKTVNVQAQANVAITSITRLTGSGTYVGGMIFNVRVAFGNTGGTLVTGVIAVLSFGAYPSLTSNASNTISLAAGSTGRIDFQISIATLAATSPVTINATWNATEAISARALSGNADGYALNVVIQSQTVVQFSSLIDLTGKASTGYVAGMSFVMRVVLTNQYGGTAAVGVTAGLNFQGNSFLTTNASASITIAAGATGHIDFNVTIGAGASNTVALVTTFWNGQEAISGRTYSDSSSSILPVIIKARAQASIVGITYRTGSGTYIGGMPLNETLVVSVAFSNIGGASANNMMATLSFGGYQYMYIPSLPPPTTVPVGGTIVYQYFVVSINVTAPTASITISATWTASEEISNRSLSGTSGAHNLAVQIKAQASVSITGIIYTTGSGTYVAGMTFTLRVNLQNVGGATADTVTVTPLFGGYNPPVFGLSTNASNSIVLTSGATGHIDFFITISAGATTQNPLTITASYAGIEEISLRSLSGTSGGVFRNVVILSKSRIIISSVVLGTSTNESAPFLWANATIKIKNLGGAAVNLGNVSIFLNSTYAQTPTAVNQSTGLTVPAGGLIGVLIKFFVSAATPNGTRILVSANFIGIEAISGSTCTPTSIASTILTVVLGPFSMGISIVGNRFYYVRSSDSFVVKVVLDNVPCTTPVTNGNLSLQFIGASGYSVNPTIGYTGLSIGIGNAIFKYFNVTVTGTATLGKVRFYAKFTGNNPNPLAVQTVNETITTLTKASVSISSINLVPLGAATFVAGMSFVIRVMFQNTGGTAAINLNATLHFNNPLYQYTALTGLIMVVNGSTGHQDFGISIFASSSTTIDNITATWTGNENYSSRALSGVSGSGLSIKVLSRASITITGMSYSAQSFWNGGPFNVNVTFKNTGGANVTVLSANLVANVSGYLTGVIVPGPITVGGGSTVSIIFRVTVSSLSPIVNDVHILITASFSGQEQISYNLLNGTSGIHNVTITIPARANIFITGITIESGNVNATFHAGQTFTVRVKLNNTGGLDGVGITVTLVYPENASVHAPTSGLITVPAHGSNYTDITVTIGTDAATMNFSITATWSGSEIYSTRSISGNSGQIQVEVQIIAAKKPDYLSIFIVMACLGVFLGIVGLVTKPKEKKETLVPGKKKTCKQCGKYVKPYAATCPYCGFKLSEEETMTEAMNKLRHLFIFHEDSGVCVFYHAFTDQKIDPQLISGFLSAITSFGGQFEDATTKKKAVKEGASTGKATSDLKELVYKEYRILMETSGPCKFAVLITGQTSKILTFKISQFIKHFMRTYDEALKDWKGNVRIFKDADKMVRLIFGLTKVQPEGGKPAAPAEKAGEEGEAPATEQQPQKPAKTSALAPMKPVPPATPGAEPSPSEKGQKAGGASSLFKLKEQIGVPGEFTPPAPKAAKPVEKPAKGVFSPKSPPEMEKKDKKKKKQ